MPWHVPTDHDAEIKLSKLPEPRARRDLNEGRPSPEGELNGLRVLVVEDSWEVATGLAGLLESWGADVLGPVATAADALHLISHRTAEAAVVDINLRGGERAYGLIDSLHGQGIRVVVISGYTDIPVVRGKVAAILRKPMQVDLLLQSLRSGQNNENQ